MVLAKASASGIMWSEGASSTSASGSIRAAISAAMHDAGAVFRPHGSRTIEPAFVPISSSCSAIRKRYR